VVDICKEHIAVAEAKKLGIPTFAIVDTNSNPNEVDFPIPANDDAAKSISIILKLMIDSIEEGIAERKIDKDKQIEDEKDEAFELDKLKSKTLAELEEEEEEETKKKSKKVAAKSAVKIKEEEEEAERSKKMAAKPSKGNVKKIPLVKKSVK